MRKNLNKLLILTAIAATCCGTAKANREELMAYYNEQKATLINEFDGPSIGDTVSVKLASGTVRSGKIVAIDDKAVTIETKAGPIPYQRDKVAKESRQKLFAEDWADAIARERTYAKKRSMIAANGGSTGSGGSAAKAPAGAKPTGKLTPKITTEKTSDKNEEFEQVGSKDVTTVTKTKSEAYQLSAKVQNPAKYPQTYTLEWYFIAEYLSQDGTEELQLREKGSTELELGPMARTEHKVSAQPMVMTEQTIDTQNNENDSSSQKDPTIKKSGDSPGGYVVLLKSGDTLVAKKYSSKKYESDEWAAKLKEEAQPMSAAKGGKGGKGGKKGKKGKKNKNK